MADSTRSAAAYKASALQDQPRISDVIPRPSWAFGLMLLWGASVIGGLLFAYDWLEPASNPRHAIFDLTWTGSLANWFAAFLLMLVAAVAGICYSLRRQKQTDYHGHYRVWRWTAALALLASVAATTNWHVVAGWELARVTPWNVSSGSLLWWLVPAVLVLGTLCIRLVLEMRPSPAATLSMSLALVCYAVVVGFKLWQPAAVANTTSVMTNAGSLLAGHLLLLISFAWYARYIILDMQGLISHPESERSTRQAEQQPKKQRSARSEKAHPTPPTPKRRTDVDPDQPTRRTRQLVEEVEEEAERLEQQERRAQRKQRGRRRQAEPEPEEIAPQPTSQKKLTKSERKRLRKLKAQQREAA